MVSYVLEVVDMTAAGVYSCATYRIFVVAVGDIQYIPGACEYYKLFLLRGVRVYFKVSDFLI